MRNYVIINGVNSNTINGLAINELPPITKPPMRVLQEEIDGRDGDITTNLGYGAYDKVMTIGLFHTFDINQIIAFFNGSGTIVFSNEPDKKYNYKIIDQIDYEKLISFKTATVTLHCQPFKYPLEETPLIIEPTIDTLENVTSASIETNENTLSTTLKGNTSQYSTTGKNKLPNERTTITENGITITKNSDGTYKVNGTATADVSLAVNQDTFIPMSGTWRMVGCPSGGSANTYMLSDYVGYWGTASPNIDTGSGTNITYTGDVKVRFYIKSGTTCNNLIFKPMITTDTSATYDDFEPYTNGASPNPSYPQDIHNVSGDNTIEICGKNLFDSKYGQSSSVYTTHINASSPLYDVDCYPIQLKPSTQYTLTIDMNGYAKGDSWIAGLCFANGSVISLIQYGTMQDLTTATFTTDSTGVVYVGQRYGSDSSRMPLFLQTAKVQIEVGNTSTTYKAYTEQSQLISLGDIELCKIGDYEDEFFKNTIDSEYYDSTLELDKWYLKKRIGKVVLDGSESWARGNPTHRYYFATTGQLNYGANPVSNYFIGYVRDNLPGNINGLLLQNISESQMRINIYDLNIVDDLASFKNWLSTHNTDVYYVLATPTNTEITDTTLLEQLDSLMSATTYYGVTNINQDNSDLPFMLDITYFEKDTNKVIVNNIGNIYSKPTIALEGNGTGGIYLNGNQVFNVTLTDKMTISTKDMEAYNPDTQALLNRAVTGNYNSMTLQPSNNTIKVTGGITKATITDYTRWL